MSVVALGLVVGWFTLPDVHPLARVNPTTTEMIELRKQEAAAQNRALRLRWSWQPLTRISPLLARAVVFAEDHEFWHHEGIDWEALKEAAERDWREGSLSRGASTITQQVAKNLYLSPSRSLLRKLRELAISRRLEAALSKARILEIYLNIAEWGDGIFGAEAAARHYYGCAATELTAAQAARLAVALPNPFKRAPSVRSAALDRHAQRLVRALARSGLLSATAAQEALQSLGATKLQVPATGLPIPGGAAPPKAEVPGEGEPDEDDPARLDEPLP